MNRRAMSLRDGVPRAAVENEYLRQALEIDPKIRTRNYWSFDVEDYTKLVRFDARRQLQRRFAWAVPNQAAIDLLVRYGPLVEMGAGTGYWANLVAQAGGDIIAFDEEPYVNGFCDGRYFAVDVGSHEQLVHHPNRTLFLCWPPMSNFAAQCLASYRGQRVVYVGEQDGCCGDDAFFAALNDVTADAEWTEVEQVRIPQWWGLHDLLIAYERRRG